MNPTPMGGKGQKIQADETYYGNSSKRAKHYRKGLRHKQSVVALDRNPKKPGAGRPFEARERRNCTGNSRSQRRRKSELQTDESNLYLKVGKEFAAQKRSNTAGIAGGLYVGKDGQTTNAVENFFGNFKRSMRGTYRFCSEQHLQRYLNEFEFRHNNRAGLGLARGRTARHAGHRRQAPDVPADSLNESLTKANRATFFALA